MSCCFGTLLFKERVGQLADSCPPQERASQTAYKRETSGFLVFVGHQRRREPIHAGFPDRSRFSR